MQLISKFNKGFRFLSWVIDIFSKYVYVVPLKYKRDITSKCLTAVESKIPNISSLVKKTDYTTNIAEIEKKFTDHNTLAADVFNARLAQASLVTKTDFDAKLSSLNRRITSNKTKQLLVEN